jgi:hypothetical protein
VAGLLQRHLPLAGQGGARGGVRRAWALANLHAGEPKHMADHGPPLWGRDQDSQQGRHHNQHGTPSQSAAEETAPRGRRVRATADTGPRGGRVTTANCFVCQPPPHGCGEVAGWRHGKFAAHRAQLGLHRVLPSGPVSHW